MVITVRRVNNDTRASQKPRWEASGRRWSPITVRVFIGLRIGLGDAKRSDGPLDRRGRGRLRAYCQTSVNLLVLHFLLNRRGGRRNRLSCGTLVDVLITCSLVDRQGRR